MPDLSRILAGLSRLSAPRCARDQMIGARPDRRCLSRLAAREQRFPGERLDPARDPPAEKKSRTFVRL